MPNILFAISMAGMITVLLLLIGPLAAFIFTLVAVIILLILAVPVIIVLSPWIVGAIAVWLIFF